MSNKSTEIIEELEALVLQSARIPLSTKTIVNEEKFLQLIDTLRQQLPDTINQAEQILAMQKNILLEAENKAKAVVTEAEDKARKMIQEVEEMLRRKMEGTDIMKVAKEESDKMIQEARTLGKEVREGAEKYAKEVLTDLESQVNILKSTIRNGISQLENKEKQP